LYLLAAAAILPLAAMAGVGLWLLVQQQQAQAERSGLDISRALATAVDAELNQSVAALQVLSTSLALDQGDIPGFYARAQRVMASRPDWLVVILADPQGHVLANTGQPLGRALPPVVERPSFDRVVQTRQPVIGDLARGARGEYAVPARVPVLLDGELRYVLTAAIRPQAIAQVVRRQRVPSDWVVSVFDAKGLRVARSRVPESIGTQAAPSLKALMNEHGLEGAGSTQALEGDSVYSAYTRSAQSGWTVAVGIPDAQIEAAAYRSLAAYGGGLLLSIALGALAAWMIARSINRPIGALRQAAQSLGSGAIPELPPGEIPELQEVSDALAASVRQRAQGETERERLLNSERLARAEAEQARRRLELLASAGAELSRSLEPQATLRAIAAVVVPGIADWCRIDLVDAEGRLQRGLTHHADAGKAQEATRMVERLHPDPTVPGTMGWCIATGHSQLVNYHTLSELSQIRDPDMQAFARAIGMRAYFVVPLIARGRTLGAMAALQAESGRLLQEEDCALLSELAQRAALALDNARLYAEAEAARHHAEAANRTKDEFLAMLGHELRNPLAPIVTALHLMALRDGEACLSERQVIERQVGHLSRLVDDLLDVSRITRGKVQLQRERVDLRKVVARALEMSQPLLDQRPSPVALDQPAVPVPVLGDEVRLAQVFGNLLTNAAKFTPPHGHIGVSLHTVDGMAEVVVEDAGSGIAPDLLPHVFELFVQGRQSLDRQVGGLGLGLAIVKTLVEMHGGQVSAESLGESRGSRFIVRLPLAAEAEIAAPLAAPGAAPRAEAGRRVLIVDDNLDAAQTLVMVLEELGYEARSASDGRSALALLDGFVPEVAVLDIGLPGMDGYELARRLRADARIASIRLLALTGYGSEVDRQRALEAGFDEHLIKPVSIESLLSALDRWLGSTALNA
jgi:signal transduction histidine kinase/ActR/RegA family two-component response regulator